VLIANVSAPATASATTADAALLLRAVTNAMIALQLKWPVGTIAPQDMFVSAADIKLFTSAKLVSS
jgi:hypothetical protein